VKGDFHARFLGGGAAATPPCYPAQPTPLRGAAELGAVSPPTTGIENAPEYLEAESQDYEAMAQVTLHHDRETWQVQK